MLAIVLFCLFIALGIYIARRIFFEEQVLIQGWIGALVGLLAFIWLVIPFSFIFTFGYLSHFLAAGIFIATSYAIKKCLPVAAPVSDIAKSICQYIPQIIFTVGLSLLVSILLFTHVIQPKPTGWYGGQSTWGDLPLHLGIVSSIVNQKSFPPEYSILPGSRLSYPFLVDSLSSSFYLMGINLRWSILLPSMFLVPLLILGFLFFAQERLCDVRATLLSAVFFFFNGGFGFAYFLDKLKANPQNFTRIFTSFYNTPTNYTDQGIYWANVICDLLIPQRTTLAGWTFLFCVIWFLDRAIHKSSKKYYFLGGIVAGLMPMIHTHSFLAIVLVVLTWFTVYFWEQKNKTEYIKNWLFFGVPLIALALPQLLYWTLPQSVGSAGNFLRFKFDWVNESDIWIWFWIKNVGLVFILIVPAILYAEKELRKFYSPSLVIFVVAELYLFQPNAYDNNKLFYVWYAFSVILVSSFLVKTIDVMPNRYAKIIMAAILILISSFSAVLSIGREWVSSYRLFSPEQVAASCFIKENTPKDSLLLSGTFHNNPISALAGRKILCGSSIYLFFHGLAYQDREKDVRRMYQDPVFFEESSKRYQVDYLYFSDYEQNDYKATARYYDENYPLVFQKGDIRIYAISDRAKATLKK